MNKTSNLIPKECIKIICGNCFDIDVISATKYSRYDRIYIGASCLKSRLLFFYDLLAEDGILIAPVSDTNELIKIHRRCGDVFTTSTISQVIFAPIIDSGQSLNHNKISLPITRWYPSRERNKQFPYPFRDIIKTILFSRPHVMYNPFILPINLWTIIFQFASRDWFIPVETDYQLLSREKMIERKLRLDAEKRIFDLKRKYTAVEQELDMLRVSSMYYYNSYHHFSSNL